MKTLIRILTVVGLVICCQANASTMIDFDSLSLMSNVTSYSEAGVTFSTPGTTFSITNTPNGSKGLIADFPRKEFRADIVGNARFVSVDLGDGGSDFDDIYLKLFDSGNNLLNSINLTCCDQKEMVKLALSAQNISYALFGSLGEYPHSIFIDNFKYKSMSDVEPVPVPPLVWIFGAAVLGLVRSKKRVVA